MTQLTAKQKQDILKKVKQLELIARELELKLSDIHGDILVDQFVSQVGKVSNQSNFIEYLNN